MDQTQSTPPPCSPESQGEGSCTTRKPPVVCPIRSQQQMRSWTIGSTGPVSVHPRAPAPFLLMVFWSAALSTATEPHRTACQRDSDCILELGEGAMCLDDGTCHFGIKNPFEQGCLHQMLPDWNQLRVCNSEDLDAAAASGRCRQPDIDHLEIRIFSQDWESAMLEAWLVQIVLSELLDVPATVETGLPGATLNFYDPQDRFDFGYSLSQQEAFDYGAKLDLDCRKASRSADNYQPCAHFIPEMWNPKGEWIIERIESGEIESPVPMGVVGREGWFVPKFTGERDPSLLTYLGLRGENNRQKLAERFLRPISWEDYCENVTLDNCRQADEVAQRPPRDESEGTRFFVDGLYTGHFRKTEKNDCKVNPNCTGHIVSWPCQWINFSPAQLYHLGIALEGDGQEPNMGGYTYRQMKEIWKAANATKSDVIMTWYSPEIMFQSFQGTDAEFLRVGLPVATRECIDNRVEQGDQCSDDFQTRVGDPRGACDTPAILLHKATLAGLSDAIQSPSIPKAIQSPAYEALELFSISELQIGEVLGQLPTKAPRKAMCQWIVENFDFVSRCLVPKGSRRVLQVEMPTVLPYVAMALGAASTVVVVITGLLVFEKRNRRVMKFAQVEFLWLLLTGALSISVGAMVTAIAPPTDASCVAGIWLINIGYTLELVPLIVKVAAINRLMHAAQQMRRVTLRRRSLFGAVFLISALVILFLTVWTALDPPQKQTHYELTENMTPDGKSIVTVFFFCDSGLSFWNFVAVGWNAILLLCAAVLAFQTRNIRQDFNESSQLAVMIYSHFVFVVLRVISYLLTSVFAGTALAGFWSIIYSIDTMATVVIYFVPKFLAGDNVGRRASSISEPARPEAASAQTMFGPALLRISNISTLTSRDESREKSDQAVVSSTSQPPGLVEDGWQQQEASRGVPEKDSSVEPDGCKGAAALLSELEASRATASQLRSTLENQETVMAQQEQAIGRHNKTIADRDATILGLKEEIASLMERLVCKPCATHEGPMG